MSESNRAAHFRHPGNDLVYNAHNMNRREFLGGLAAVSLASSQQRPREIQAVVMLQHGRPTMFLNDRPAPPVIYALGHCPGYRWSWEERPSYSISEFARAGVRLFQADIHLQQMWPSPEHFDIELGRKQVRGILDACPEAAVMLRLHVNSPPWWNQAHPEECVRWAGKSFEQERPWGMTVSMDGDLMRVPRHSLASRRWLDECGAKTREFCQKLAATPEGAALFSIQVAAGVFGEWHYYGFTENEPDVGPAMTTRFREWLTARYGQTLPYEAIVPGIQERIRADGYLRDPRRDRRVIDYLHCQHEAVTDAFIHFCRAVKESWPRPIVTAGFHGYWFTMFGRMGAGGHLAVRRALESPYVDALCAPQSYENMRAGEPGISRGVIDSARLHGKLWLDEMDTMPAVWDPTIPKAEARARSISYLRSNVLAPLTRGMGLWYYDLVCEEDYSPDHRAAGLWDTRPMQAEITRIEKLRKRTLQPAVQFAGRRARRLRHRVVLLQRKQWRHRPGFDGTAERHHRGSVSQRSRVPPDLFLRPGENRSAPVQGGDIRERVLPGFGSKGSDRDEGRPRGPAPDLVVRRRLHRE